MATITVNTDLTTIDCGCCGGVYAIQEQYRVQAYEDGKSWTCPYCKASWGYSKNSLREQLERKLEAERQAVMREQQRHDQTKAALRETENSRRAEKAAKTRIKNRVQNGVCIHCNRTFKDLASHMACKHPVEANAE